EALREAGYATHIVGKWHVGHARREYLPTEQGFDHHYGLYLMSVDYFTHANGGGLDWHRDARPVKEKGYATDLLAAEAVRIIREHPADKPLFLYVPFSAPHSPLQATQEYVARYRSIEDESRRIYAAMVTCLDAGVGRIVRAIEERGFERNTLIVFCSDNGASLSYGGSNAMLSGRKGSTFEGGVRAPAIVVWPGQLEAGRRITEPIHVIDWYPTLVNLAGGSLDQPRPLDGVDLWPLLSQKTPLPPRDLILKATRRGGTILRGEWKLMVTSGNDAGRLFNLEDDPFEQRDVREAHADLAAELRAALVPYQRAVVGNPQSGKRPARFETPAVWGADHGYERKKTIPPRRERKHGKDD
ncbi:MAG: arylsulfatase, partial [Planctomycetota bacterium]